MVIADLEVETISRNLNTFVSKRRATLDGETTVYLSYTINENGVKLMENAPDPYDSGKVSTMPFAEISYIDSTCRWKVAFLRPDPDWQAFEPEEEPEATSFPEALRLIREKSKSWYF